MKINLSEKQIEFVKSVGDSFIFVDQSFMPPRVSYDRVVKNGTIESEKFSSWVIFWNLLFTPVIQTIGKIDHSVNKYKISEEYKIV